MSYHSQHNTGSITSHPDIKHSDNTDWRKHCNRHLPLIIAAWPIWSLIARIENISRDDRYPNLPMMPHQTFLQELRATIAAARSGQKIMQLEISLACSCAIKCLCSNTIEIVECTPHQQSFSILRKHKQHINSNCRLAVEGVTDPSHLPGCSHYHYFADHYPICCLNRSHLKS